MYDCVRLSISPHPHQPQNFLTNRSAAASATPSPTNPAAQVLPTTSPTRGQNALDSRCQAASWADFSELVSAYRVAWEDSFSLSPPTKRRNLWAAVRQSGLRNLGSGSLQVVDDRSDQGERVEMRVRVEEEGDRQVYERVAEVAGRTTPSALCSNTACRHTHFGCRTILHTPPRKSFPLPLCASSCQSARTSIPSPTPNNPTAAACNIPAYSLGAASADVIP